MQNIDELIAMARAGDIEARNKIIEGHIYIIDIVAHKLFRKNKYSDESTKRYGALLGLIAAIRNYDPLKGDSFERYAYYCAWRRAQREMNEDLPIRVPSGIIAKFAKNMEVPYEVMSLSEKNAKGGARWYSKTRLNGEPVIDTMLDELVTYDAPSDVASKKILEKIFNELTPLEKDAIYHRCKCHDMTLLDIGKQYGVSHEWVRVTSHKAFTKLKKDFFREIKQKQKICV